MIRWINGSDVAFSHRLSVFVISTNQHTAISNILTAKASSVHVCHGWGRNSFHCFTVFYFYYGNERTLLFELEQLLNTVLCWLQTLPSYRLINPLSWSHTHTYTHRPWITHASGIHVLSRWSFDRCSSSAQAWHLTCVCVRSSAYFWSTSQCRVGQRSLKWTWETSEQGYNFLSSLQAVNIYI